MFINSINTLRAIAIIIIVSGHFFSFAKINCDSYFEKFIFCFITGGSGLFVFISGFLFHFIFFEKKHFQNIIKGEKNYFWFIKQKVNNVFSPYLVLGAAPVIYYTFIDPTTWYNNFFIPDSIGILNKYILPFIKYYWTGAFLTAYWYLPFIMITFLLSPFHIIFIKIPLKIQLGILILLSMISVFIHRPIDNLYVFQSVIYFTPYYLLGILFSQYKEYIYKILANKEFLFFLLVILIIVLQILSGNIDNYHKLPFVYRGVDLMFLQKVVLCIFFFIWLHRFENYNNKIINYIADTSFTIFFLHPYFKTLFGILHNNIENYFSITYQESWIFFIFLVIFTITLCVIVAKLTKRIIPKYSRFILGY